MLILSRKRAAVFARVFFIGQHAAHTTVEQRPYAFGAAVGALCSQHER
jgi:hypothetical protein